MWKLQVLYWRFANRVNQGGTKLWFSGRTEKYKTGWGLCAEFSK